MIEPRELVEIEWEDITTEVAGWDTTEAAIKRCSTSTCRSVGYLMFHDEEVVKIAMMTSLDEDMTGTWSAIPTGCIRKMKTLTDRVD